MSTLISPNEEAIRAWDGPLFDIWVRYREMLVTGVAKHGEVALERHPPQPGERVLDIGCGLGDTTRTIAGMVGPDGEAVGLDAAPRMIETAKEDARDVTNARFIGRRPPGRDGPRRSLRPRVLPLRDDVLREPRRRPAQRARQPPARRQAHDGRLAAQARQRVDAPRRADRRVLPRAAGAVGRADVRARAVLDGQRRHGLRGADLRGLPRRRALPLRSRHGARRPRQRGGHGHVDRPRRRGPAPAG